MEKTDASKHVLLLFDCCNSGTICDLKYVCCFYYDENEKLRLSNHKYETDGLNNHIICISSARDNQYAYELPYFDINKMLKVVNGTFTLNFCNQMIIHEDSSLRNLLERTIMNMNNLSQIPIASTSKELQLGKINTRAFLNHNNKYIQQTFDQPIVDLQMKTNNYWHLVIIGVIIILLSIYILL